MPSWAADGVDFFRAADANERANGRTYTEIEAAIPRGCADPEAYATEYAEQLLGKSHPYRLAVHDKAARDGGRNIHMHLMFSDRKLDGIERGREQFFRRAAAPYRHRGSKEMMPADPAKGGAGKDRKWNERAQVQAVRSGWETYAKERGFDLDLRSNLAQGMSGAEPKIGPQRQRRQPDRFQEARQGDVDRMRSNRKAIAHAKADLSAIEKELELHQAQAQAEKELAKQRAAAVEAAAAAARQVARQRAAEQQRAAERPPAQRLAEFLAGPNIGPGVEMTPKRLLDDLSVALKNFPENPVGWLGEAGRQRLREHHLIAVIDGSDRLTDAGRAVLALLDAQQAEQERQRQAALAKQQAAQEQQRQAARLAAEQERGEQEARKKEGAARQADHVRQAAETQERRSDLDTAERPGDSIRAPQSSADDWQRWRRLMLEGCQYERSQAEVIAGLGKLDRTPGGLRLVLWRQAGAVLDTGDRLMPQGHPPADDEIKAALLMARAKGWDQDGGIDITGSSAFRERAARMAVRQGMAVGNADLQIVVADESARIAQDLRAQAPVPTSPRSAPVQAVAAVPEKQAQPAQEAAAALELEALEFLGADPTKRWERLYKLKQSTQTQAKPVKAERPGDRKKALDEWIANRRERGESYDRKATEAVFDQIEKNGVTSDSILAWYRRDEDEKSSKIRALEEKGSRWIGGNRNAQQIAQALEEQKLRMSARNAEVLLARDYETFRPGFVEREYEQRLATWQRDVALYERIKPYAEGIIDRDKEERQEQAAERETRRLDVPYKEKEEAKALGAEWDYERLAWYAKPGADMKALEKWVPKPGAERQQAKKQRDGLER